MESEPDFLHDLSGPLTAALLSLECYLEPLSDTGAPVANELQRAVEMLTRLSALIERRKAQILADNSGPGGTP